MPAQDACQAAASLLPTLEPLLGVSVALNLAYLNISKFAYVSVVKGTISSRLAKLDKHVHQRVKATEWYRQLSALATVDTFDEGFPKLSRTPWIAAPGLWGKFYNVLFYWRIGRAVSIFVTAHALLLLILGVGHSSGVITSWRCAFSAGRIGDDFFWVTAGLLWPLAMVATGSLVCFSAAKFVRYQTTSLEQEAKTEAREALDRSQEAVSATNPDQMGPQMPVTHRSTWTVQEDGTVLPPTPPEGGG